MKSIKWIYVYLIAGLFTACLPEKREIQLDLEELSIENIHAKYSSGELTAVSLVESYLARIDSVNPQINALPTLKPHQSTIAKL